MASSSTLVSPRTMKRILEILCDETEFLVDSKLLGLLAPLPHTQQCLLKLDTIFKALGVDTEEDVHTLAKFLLDFQKATGTHDKEETLQVNENDAELKGVADLSVEPFIDPNTILQALKVFVAQHCRPDRNVQAEGGPVSPKWSQRDSSRDALYWQSLAEVVPPAQLRIWDVLTSTLQKYRYVEM
uniref:dynein regulatory complex protein 1-like isoform X2 n=1 Tax=Myxine glutinosa TaxID=7769 RepID=UPI00358E6A33